VTADHGQSVGPFSRRIPEDGNMAEIYGVPLFIKEPGQVVRTRSPAVAFSSDILPTIADVLDVEGLDPNRWDFDGQSLLDPDLPLDRPYQMVGGNRRPHPDTGPIVLATQLQRHDELIADRTSWAGIAMGVHPELIGRNARELPPTDQPPERMEWLVDQHIEFSVPRTRNGFVPAQITGTVSFDDKWSEPVTDAVVIVNTFVVGSGHLTETDDGHYRFEGVMDPTVELEAGRNAINLVVRTEDGWQRGLRADRPPVAEPGVGEPGQNDQIEIPPDPDLPRTSN